MILTLPAFEYYLTDGSKCIRLEFVSGCSVNSRNPRSSREQRSGGHKSAGPMLIIYHDKAKANENKRFLTMNMGVVC